MNHVNKQFVANQGPGPALASFMARVKQQVKQTEPLKLIWWCLALSIVSSTLTRYLTENTGLIYPLMVIMGSGACAWTWLLSRALFRGNQALQSKVVYWVPAVILVEALHGMLSPAMIQASEFVRVFNNVASLVCIAAIVFVGHETLSGFSQIRSAAERRFRLLFLIVYSIPVAVAILWVMGAEAGSFAAAWQDALLTACAMIGLVGTRLAVWYRLQSKQSLRTAKTTVEPDSELLSKQILSALSNDVLLTKPHLKVADLAEHIQAQEYKVTRCITSQLNYRNFNHMLNHHRIERAIQVFNAPESHHLKVATIAFDCGFNSLGPFNRAFKQHTGMTPREFRQRQVVG